MQLVVDIGNTRIKKALFDGDRLMGYDPDGQHPIDCAILSASGDADYAFPAIVRLHRLTPQSRLPITLCYDTPETLGSDRIADACGAWKLFPHRDCLIVDAGTCITIDYLDAQSTYHGGAILPGIEMKFRALNTFTSRLPLISYQTEAPLCGKSTQNSILAGVVTATRMEVEGFVSAYRAEHPDIAVVVTGGDAERLQTTAAEIVPDLGLIGLNEILKLNS